MHVVLSTMRTSLEDTLVEHGRDVLVLVPTSIHQDRVSQAAGRYQVRAIKSWDDSGQIAKIAGELRHTPITSVDTTDEMCLNAAALLRSLLHLPGQSRTQALRATDKAVMKDALHHAGVPTAHHRRLASVSEAPAAAQDLGWPLVVKPRRGFGTLGTHVITDQQHLGRLISSGAFNGLDLPAGFDGSGIQLALDAVPGGVLAEEYIDVATEYHIEVLRWAGETIYAIPARYAAPLLGSKVVGSVLLQPGDEHDQAVALAHAAADALELQTGFAHVELLKDRAGTWRVGEIGLRPGGGKIPQLLSLHHGIDVPGIAAEMAMGKRPSLALSANPLTTAWISGVAPQGRITDIAPSAEISSRPGVIEAATDLHTGQISNGPKGSVAIATHVYAQAATSDEAERIARDALRSWRITVAPLATACVR